MFWLLINQYQNVLQSLKKKHKGMDDQKNFQEISAIV